MAETIDLASLDYPILPAVMSAAVDDPLAMMDPKVTQILAGSTLLLNQKNGNNDFMKQVKRDGDAIIDIATRKELLTLLPASPKYETKWNKSFDYLCLLLTLLKKIEFLNEGEGILDINHSTKRRKRIDVLNSRDAEWLDRYKGRFSESTWRELNRIYTFDKHRRELSITTKHWGTSSIIVVAWFFLNCHRLPWPAARVGRDSKIVAFITLALGGSAPSEDTIARTLRTHQSAVKAAIAKSAASRA
jgi:hypothetical protein